ncbi:DUF4129 domain-containing protein [Haladaptatus salinisoli]|uniref:DUF4129 domain-containing protein n=1 Tax=Haladaptatus salinisoli TaxID=2884876 RepID=UPI001D09E02A|nr:DUF4129 domain-containing protein [Haladaptatus salinisoli]
MDTDTARPVVIALLCVLAISLAAATLNSAVTEDGSGGTGFGSGSGGTGFGEENRSSPSGGRGAALSVPIELPCYPVLASGPAILAIAGAFLLLVGVAYRRKGLLGAFAIVGPVGVPILLVHALLTACTVSAPRGSKGRLLPFNRSNFSLPGGGSGGLGDGASTVMTPSLALFVVLGIALVGAVVLLVKSSGGSEPDTPASEETPGEEDVAAVGRAAGEAADRIESEASVENEVYRAWREMTRHLDVRAPESSTPGEFAAAAVDAGMGREDVSELTAVFEEVRYGGEDATGDRERRAVSALRRIERRYAEDER